MSNQHLGPFSSCSMGHTSSCKLSSPFQVTVQHSMSVTHCVSVDALIHDLMLLVLQYAAGPSQPALLIGTQGITKGPARLLAKHASWQAVHTLHDLRLGLLRHAQEAPSSLWHVQGA